jgi:hypothetical protein
MYHTLEYNNDNDADDSDDGGNIIYNTKKIGLYLFNTHTTLHIFHNKFKITGR